MVGPLRGGYNITNPPLNVKEKYSYFFFKRIFFKVAWYIYKTIKKFKLWLFVNRYYSSVYAQILLCKPVLWVWNHVKNDSVWLFFVDWIIPYKVIEVFIIYFYPPSVMRSWGTLAVHSGSKNPSYPSKLTKAGHKAARTTCFLLS